MIRLIGIDEYDEYGHINVYIYIYVYMHIYICVCEPTNAINCLYHAMPVAGKDRQRLEAHPHQGHQGRRSPPSDSFFAPFFGGTAREGFCSFHGGIKHRLDPVR